jgi:glyoxylase-like metal-dependent hydrolase (beta-lactamase superfamily II)
MFFHIFRRILVDAGEQNDIHYMERLQCVLKEENIDLEHIIVTHWHHDHIGGVHDVVNIMNNGEFLFHFLVVSINPNYSGIVSLLMKSNY